VRKMTTIPVPKVYCAFKHRHKTYILMEHIDGEPIGKNWDNRSDTEKESLMSQLKGIFDELHSIRHPRPGVLAAADMQPLYDPRCWKGFLGFGLFASESEFNNYLRCNMNDASAFFDKDAVPWVTTEERNEVRRLLDMQQSKQHSICFTHGDANSTNILVKNGKVVALIDFEVSGWYPEYWSVVSTLIIKMAVLTTIWN
jgi:aminoglycoside phosphotransferase (APT) family kinase protein